MLPQHRPPPRITYPVIYEGLGFYELAAWHQHFKARNELDKCEQIETAVSKLSQHDQHYIRKLNFYIPVGVNNNTQIQTT